jgi:RNA polymerase sigma-70 factor (TIGR02943 family)
MEEMIENSGKQKTIAQWAQDYTSKLFSWALHKVSDKAVAEDLVQETFLAATDSYEKFRGASSPHTWLFKILNNKIMDHYRKSYKNHELTGFHPHDEHSFGFDTYFDQFGNWIKKKRPQEWQNDDQSLLDNETFRETLEMCLKNLPSKWLAVVHLKYLEEKDSKDIFCELEITPANFWQILHRAKLKLRECLEFKWFRR